MNEELNKTAKLMMSEDYKERFLAEYIQLKNRYYGLLGMMKKWESGNLPFVPTCPKEIYSFQLEYMKKYLDILTIRAKIEGIELC